MIFTKKYISGRFQIAHARHSKCDYCDVGRILPTKMASVGVKRLNLES